MGGAFDIHGIGEEMAADTLGFFAEPHNRAVLDDLAREVTVLDYEAPAQRTASPLAGKTLVFTGTLQAMSRSEAKARAEALGANVTGTVSGKTDYVVAGADPGSKATKAAALGVTLLDEAAARARRRSRGMIFGRCSASLTRTAGSRCSA